MDTELKNLLIGVGKTIEDVGRIIQKKPELSLDDLTSLQTTLSNIVETIKIAKETIIFQRS